LPRHGVGAHDVLELAPGGILRLDGRQEGEDYAASEGASAGG
jgi:hypothetical protein